LLKLKGKYIELIDRNKLEDIGRKG
jgi:hypothetical protein